MAGTARRGRRYAASVRLRIPRAESLLAWAGRRRRPDRHRLGADTGDGQPRPARTRRAAAGLPRSGARRCDGIRARARLGVARARAPAAPRLAARDRDRRRVGHRPPREGPRRRGGDDLAGAAPRARAVPAPLRRAGRSGDGPAAARGRRRARRDRLGRRRRRAARSRAARIARPTFLTGLGIVLAFAALYFLLRPAPRSSRRRSASSGWPARSSTPTAATASRSSRSGATRAISSRPRGALPRLPRRRGSALVSGDPVGDEDEFDALLLEFRRVARAHGWRLAVVGASDQHLDRYRALGLRADSDGGGGRAPPGRLLARGPRDPEGAAVGVAPREGGLRAPRRRRRARRSGAPRASSTSSRPPGAATQPERGFSMAIDDLVPRRDRVRRRRGRRRAGRRVPPSGADAGGRRLVALDDAPPAASAERV